MEHSSVAMAVSRVASVSNTFGLPLQSFKLGSLVVCVLHTYWKPVATLPPQVVYSK